MLDECGNVVKSDFGSIEEAITWATLELENEQKAREIAEQKSNKLAEYMDDLIKTVDKNMPISKRSLGKHKVRK